MSQVRILAIFGDGASAARAASLLRAHDVGDVLAYSPTPDHSILSELQHDVSPVRLFTLIGAGLGCFLGVAFPVYTMLDWPLIFGDGHRRQADDLDPSARRDRVCRKHAVVGRAGRSDRISVTGATSRTVTPSAI